MTAPPRLRRARAVLLPEGLVADRVIETDDDGVVVDVRVPRASDPEPMNGMILPGLVNAHLHLELSWLAGAVEGRGAGFVDWLKRFLTVRLALPGSPELPRIRAAEEARGLVAAGVAAVGDVDSEGWAAPILAEAGLRGVSFGEVLGFGRDVRADRLRRARAPAESFGAIVRRPAPHAVYSTPGEVIVAATGSRGGAPSSIHLAEDPGEEAMLHGEGPFAAHMDEIGLDWRWMAPPRCSPVAWLERLGVLGPDLLVVHGVHLSDSDRATLARTQTPLCLCPRSNLHIGGQLPDVPALLAAGVSLALGTDSLASCGDLDVLGEVAVLRRAYPDIALATWLQLATQGGADALGLPLGRIEVGARPGLLWLDDDMHTRRWLEAP